MLQIMLILKILYSKCRQTSFLKAGTELPHWNPCFINTSQRVIEQLEQKQSSVREELVATKEALNRALLDKEVLDGRNKELGKFCYMKLHLRLWNRHAEPLSTIPSFLLLHCPTVAVTPTLLPWLHHYYQQTNLHIYGYYFYVCYILWGFFSFHHSYSSNVYSVPKIL